MCRVASLDKDGIRWDMDEMGLSDELGLGTKIRAAAICQFWRCFLLRGLCLGLWGH